MNLILNDNNQSVIAREVRRGTKRQDRRFATRSDPKGLEQERRDNLFGVTAASGGCRSRSSFAMT